jgi:hypothetical protein
VADFDKLLEECIDEYMKIKKITAVIRITDTDGQTYLTAQELSQGVKNKIKGGFKDVSRALISYSH